MSAANDTTILLIGATGYIGGLLTATLLSNERCRIVTPIRSGHTREDIIQTVKLELAAERLSSEIDFSRIITVPLPPISELESLFAVVSKLEVQEIIHCAGSVDYFDSARLKEANIDLTAKLISLGCQLQVKRFIYISTAFSCGFTKGLVNETLHTSPDADPTEYTKSKREAEALVANSSLPYMIIRPSVVIGDSRDGHYSGQAYGLYQYWKAFEKFLCDRYRPELHFIAPKSRLQVIHQDAFTAAFLAAYHHLPDNSIVHLVSRHETLPTVRELTHLWNMMYSRPRTVHYYDSLNDVPPLGLDRRMRIWLEFTSVNAEISAHPWAFQTAALDSLRAGGLKFRDATIDSISVCQERFVAQSPRLQSFLATIERPLGAAPQVFEVQSPQSKLNLSSVS